MVVVDDASPDRTAQAVEEYIQAHGDRRGGVLKGAAQLGAGGDRGVVVLKRPGKLGLAGAVLEGATMTLGDYVVMMDADLSHDPAVIPLMLRKLDEGYHVGGGSRDPNGASGIEGWPWRRRVASRLAIGVARLLLPLGVNDLTSGFAAFRRMYITDLPTRFSVGGFKLLLEVLAVWPNLRVAEHPIVFVDRHQGKSKFGLKEMVEFGRLCLRLWWYRLWHRRSPLQRPV